MHNNTLSGINLLMDMDILIGIIITAVALILVGSLTFMAKRTIERIEDEGYRTARETLKDLTNGR